MDGDDLTSALSHRFNTSVDTSIKGRRLAQIKRIDRELIKLSKRYDQVTDPAYITQLKTTLK